MIPKIQKSKYIPIFTPRLRLTDSTVVGIEIAVRQNQKLLNSDELFQLILSGNAQDLLNLIKHHIEKWPFKEETQFYVTWEVMGNTAQNELVEFLGIIGPIVQPNRLEIALNFDNMQMLESTRRLKALVSHLRNNSIRVCFYHYRPMDIIPNDLEGLIDSVKFRNGLIVEIMDDLLKSSQLRYLIDNLGKRKIEIIVDDLYSKSDVTCVILMGIAYGQGYYLSRNNAIQHPVKSLKKKPGSDVYERRISLQQISLA